MRHYVAFLLLVTLGCIRLTVAQEQSQEEKKINFMIGKWKSVSIDQRTGKQTIGQSEIRWIIGGKWLQWKFSMPLDNGLLEVLTLINYHDEKKSICILFLQSHG